jgi:dTDP-4-amino-4,6-dideoxy-D-galactose acyltransferase
MEIEILNWDSNFFGLKIGRINITSDIEIDWQLFKEKAINGKFELIYVFKYQKMLPWEATLKGNLDLVDIQLTLSKKFEKKDYLNLNYDLRTEITENEKIQCYSIAEETSIVSRFFREKKIGAILTKQLYRKWIDNALNKTFSDGLLLEKDSSIVTGIHSIKTDNVNKIGYCSLIGVNPLYKRMGIGKKLWMQSFAYWADNCDINTIKIPFSLQNSESFNFHLKMGFDKIEETKYIYHYRNTFT